MVQTEALEKNHTEAFSQVAPARDLKNISPQSLKLLFLPQHCMYETGWPFCAIGPRMDWYSPSLRKCDANHWVMANHVSPRHKALLSQD